MLTFNKLYMNFCTNSHNLLIRLIQVFKIKKDKIIANEIQMKFKSTSVEDYFRKHTQF